MLEWKPEYEDELLALMKRLYPAIIAPPTPGEDWRRLYAFYDGANQVVHVASCFFVGFDVILRLDPKVALPVAANQMTADWVRKVDRSVSGGFVLGTSATALVGLLEDCLVSFVPLRAPAELLEEKIAKKITKGIKPTRDQKPEEWIESLKRVFGIDPPACVLGTLVSLILFRNNFVHEPSGTQAMLAYPGQLGALAKCWSLAAQALVVLVYVRPTAAP